MTSRRIRVFAFAATAPLGLAACTTAFYENRAHDTVTAILEEEMARAEQIREETMLWPEVESEIDLDSAAPAPASGTSTTGATQEPVRILSLEDALAVAMESNRDFKTRQEQLYFTALSLVDTQRSFNPILSATLGYVFSDFEAADATQGSSFNGSVSQILPWGGSIVLSGGTGLDDTLGDGSSPTYDTGVTVTLTQPLLRGAGRIPTREPLTQAERNLLYDIRSFELFREDFSIDVARRFYDLVQQKQSIDNFRVNLENFEFGRRQAEALFDVGRTNELDVLRARRNELNARDDLIAAVEGYQLAVDRFEIFLGLPTTEPIDVQMQAPDFIPMNFTVESAVDVALKNRLDLLNRKDQLVDSARGVRISENQLLPDLDLGLSYTVDAPPNSTFFGQELDEESWTASVTLDLPVDRILQQNSFRRSQIAYRQAVRNYEQFVDNLVVGIQSAFRELTRREQSLEIQRQLIVDQEKNVTIAQLRFERGEVSNREVEDAQQALLDARNSQINEQVNYEISRLQLLRNLGILFIDERGMWSQ